MEQTFPEALREARLASRYPRKVDFTMVAGVLDRVYHRYENGTYLPDVEHLERILSRCGIPELTAKRLRDLHAIATARKLGLDLRMLPASLNVSELAERIQREVEYELKRARLLVQGRTRQVCIRRIEMLLKDALRIP